MAALARSFLDQTAPTSAWAVSQEFRFWLFTHWARARSFDMVSAITGEMVSSASSKAKPAAFCATARAKAIIWSESMKENAPANASIPPQPARYEGRLTVAIDSERTGARIYKFPSVQWPEAWP